MKDYKLKQRILFVSHTLGVVLELEHLKIETRLISERFANTMGECAN